MKFCISILAGFLVLSQIISTGWTDEQAVSDDAVMRAENKMLKETVKKLQTDNAALKQQLETITKEAKELRKSCEQEGLAVPGGGTDGKVESPTSAPTTHASDGKLSRVITIAEYVARIDKCAAEYNKAVNGRKKARNSIEENENQVANDAALKNLRTQVGKESENAVLTLEYTLADIDMKTDGVASLALNANSKGKDVNPDVFGSVARKKDTDLSNLLYIQYPSRSYCEIAMPKEQAKLISRGAYVVLRGQVQFGGKSPDYSGKCICNVYLKPYSMYSYLGSVRFTSYKCTFAGKTYDSP